MLRAQDVQKLANVAILLCAHAGIVVSAALALGPAVSRYVPCFLFGSCKLVTESQYSAFFGVPVSYIGLLMYVAIALFTSLRLGSTSSNSAWRRRFFIITYVFGVAGLIVSLGLTWISISLIERLCSWCLASLVLITAIVFFHAIVASIRCEAEVRVFGVALAPALSVGVVAWLYAISTTGEIAHAGSDRVLTIMSEEDLFPNDAIWVGSRKARVRIAMFTDMLCGPCADAYASLSQIARSSDEVALIIRHYPLRVKGPAWQSAVRIESLREHPEFRQMLDRAYSMRDGSLGELGELREIIGARGRGPEERVKRDRDLARQLKLAGTPTFVYSDSTSPPTCMWYPDVLKRLQARSLMEKKAQLDKGAD